MVTHTTVGNHGQRVSSLPCPTSRDRTGGSLDLAPRRTPATTPSPGQHDDPDFDSNWTILEVADGIDARHYQARRLTDIAGCNHGFVYNWRNGNWYYRPPYQELGHVIEPHQVPHVVLQDFLKRSKSRTATIQPPAAPEAPAHP